MRKGRVCIVESVLNRGTEARGPRLQALRGSGGGVQAAGGKPPLLALPPPLHRACCLPCPSWADSQAGSWLSAHGVLSGQKMGTVQLAEGEAAGPGWEKSGCRLGSCAQTVCPSRLGCSPELSCWSWEGPPLTPHLLPWPYHLSYGNWRLICKGHLRLAPSQACGWLRGRPAGGQENGRA